MTKFREQCLCDKRCGIDDIESERNRYRQESEERLAIIRSAHSAIESGDADRARLLLEDHLYN